MQHEVPIFAMALMIATIMAGCTTQRIEDGPHTTSLTLPSGEAAIYYEFRNAGGTGASQKTPLVFVHGWACDHAYWSEQMDGLPGDRARLALDLPGYGKSTDGGAEHTMDLYADGVAAAMDDAGIERAVLLGHSMGTPVVRQFYRRYPDRVAGLVAVDGALRPFAPREQMEQMVAPLFSDKWQEFSLQMFDGMSAAMANDADRAHVRAVMQATSKRAMQGGFTAMADDDIWTDDPINVPLLLVLAEAPFWTDDYKQYVRTLSPHAVFETMPGTSHFLMMDQPEKFNAIVVDWLSANGL